MTGCFFGRMRLGRATNSVLISGQCVTSTRRRTAMRQSSVITRSSDDAAEYPQGGRRLDDVDRLLLSVKDYVQHPDKAVRDFCAFVAESIRLMQHVHKPKLLRESMWRSIVVLIVVIVFSSVVLGMDACLQLLPAAVRSG